MTDQRVQDWVVLLACGLAACGPTSSDGVTGGAHEAEVDDAIAACSAWATKLDACYGDATSGGYGGYNYLTALGYCIGYLGYAQDVGGGCKDAIEDLYACLSQQDCGDLFAEGDGADTGASEPSPCETQQNAVDATCDLGGDVDVTSTG